MKRTIEIVVALATAAFAAPLAAQGPGAAAGEGLVYPSRFLPDYSRLKPVPGKPGRLAWLAPDPELRGYNRFILQPLTITIDPDAQYRGLEADVMQRLAAIYQTAFARVLSPEYPVVDQPGPGVGTKQFAENQPIMWSEVEPVLSGWAQDFKDRLNTVQGR